MYGRIVKSECILTKLRVLNCEYICDRIAKFHKKILFITRVINIQILTTKYLSFQYSVTCILQSGTQLPAERLLRTRSTFSRSVAVITLGRTDLFFVDPGTKFNGQYYRDILLRQQLLPAIRGLSGDFVTFHRTTLLPTEHVRQCIC